MKFSAFKGHFLRNRRFSVIPKLLDNAAGHTDHNNGNIRPIVAPTNCGPWRVIVVMLAPHLSVLPSYPLFLPSSRDVEFYLAIAKKSAMREGVDWKTSGRVFPYHWENSRESERSEWLFVSLYKFWHEISKFRRDQISEKNFTFATIRNWNFHLCYKMYNCVCV